MNIAVQHGAEEGESAVTCEYSERGVIERVSSSYGAVDKLMTVEALPFDGNEKEARPHLSGIR